MKTLTTRNAGSSGRIRVAGLSLAFWLLMGLPLFASDPTASVTSKTQSYKKARAAQTGKLAELKKAEDPKKPATPKKADHPTPPQTVQLKKAAEKPIQKADEKPKESSEESSEKTNWVTLSGTGAFVSGDKSAFR